MSRGSEMAEARGQSTIELFLRDHLELRPGMRCLDAGCGTGAALPVLNRLVRPDGLVVGVDIDDQVLGVADSAVWALPNVSLIQADVRHLPWPPGAFDATYASLLLLWTPQPVKTIGELIRVTQPGGRVALVDVDLSTMRFEPALPHWLQFTAALRAFQHSRGFDGEIGRTLYHHAVSMGLIDVDVQAAVTVAVSGSPRWEAAWQLLTGTLASSLVEDGFLDRSELDELAAQATRQMAMPGALFVAGVTYAVSGRVQEGH